MEKIINSKEIRKFKNQAVKINLNFNDKNFEILTVIDSVKNGRTKIHIHDYGRMGEIQNKDIKSIELFEYKNKEDENFHSVLLGDIGKYIEQEVKMHLYYHNRNPFDWGYADYYLHGKIVGVNKEFISYENPDDFYGIQIYTVKPSRIVEIEKLKEEEKELWKSIKVE